jgi:hypothetical protein
MTETVMRGHGYYNTHSELQARTAAASDAVLEDALRAVAIPASGPILIADFGCSQGRNSLRPIHRALTVIEARAGTGREFMVVHVDQPGNDFASLFTLLDEDAASYRQGRPHVFGLAIGRSFYHPLLPSGSLTLGWSSIALHWLSGLPLAVAEHIWIPRGTAAERATIAVAAAADWRAFLGHRMRELAPGGQLVLVLGAMDESGSSGLEGLQDVANAALRGLVAEGRLAADRYAAMTIPSYARTRAELEAPFLDGSLPGLRLAALEISAPPSPMAVRWAADQDDAAFAEAMTGFFLAAFSPSLFGEDAALEAAFAERLRAGIAASAATLARPLTVAVLRVARV